jgi:hypothetical protein
MSTQASLTLIAICQVVTMLMVVAIGAGLIYAILMMKKMISQKVDELMNRVQPIVDQTKDIAEQAKQTAEMVSEKVDSIMSKAEGTATRVTERMDNVTAKVEESVTPQAANIAGYVAAGLKALQLFKDISAARESSSARKHHTDEDAGAHI